MKALRVHGKEDLRVEDVEPPGEPGPGEVLVAPVMGGICGSDLQLYRGDRKRADPQILCHEFAGEVVDVGKDVRSVRVGDRVAVVPIVACGRCETCRRGRGELCPGHESIGLNHRWGGFGELALMGAGQVTKVPDELTWEQAALVEPVSVSATGVERAGVRPGDRVLIVGGGPIGGFAALVAQAAGAEEVLISEPAPGRARRLRELGLEVINPTDVDVAEFCRERSDGAGFDAAVECAGNPAAFATALASVRPMGTIAVTAVHFKPVELDANDLLRRSLTLVAGYAYSLWSWPRRMAQIASGRLPVEQLVTGRLTLDRGAEAFERLLAPDSDDLKLLVEVRPSRGD